IPAEIVERVLQDLVRGRSDPERHLRRLVHQPPELGVVTLLGVAVPRRRAAPVTGILLPQFLAPFLGEQLFGVVLDAKGLLSVELFAAHQRVAAGVELETEEVGRGDELWLTRLPDQPIDVPGRRAGDAVRNWCA